MAEELSRQAHERWRQSSEKFDYFMAGLSAALLGYIAPTLSPTRVGLSSGTLELAAVLALVASTFAAFKRLESVVHIQRLTVQRLENSESVQRLTTALEDGVAVADVDSREEMTTERVEALRDNRRELVQVATTIEQKVAARARRWYMARNYLLILGFLLLVASRVWSAYAAP